MDSAQNPNLIFTERCRLSDPAHPHTLHRRDNPPPSECFLCGPLRPKFEEGGWHYYCETCEVVFHNDECHIMPQGMRHPYHPNHTLNLAVQNSETRKTRSFNNNLYEIRKLLVDALVHEKFYDSKSNETCDWCKEKLGIMFHRCSECDFSLGLCCIWKDPPFRITNPKSHQHSLIFFYNPISVPCNVCGLGGNQEPRYACLPCNYLVHKSCIDRPQAYITFTT